MSDIARVLITDIEADRFVEGVLGIHDKAQKREAINRITAAERNILTYPSYSTWIKEDCRDFEYRNDAARKDLRKQIIDELFSLKRLNNDDEITLGAGGSAPLCVPKQEKKAIYVIGPPASGKSTISSILADIYGAYIIDSDYAKRKLPEYTNQIGAASLVHEESSHIVFDTADDSLISRCFQQGNNIVVPKIGADIEGVLEFAKLLKSINYDVYLVSIDLDRQKATRRAYNRYISTNRYVPLSLIFDRYGNQPTLNYFKIKQLHSSLFLGFAQISTDVPYNTPATTIEIENMSEITDTEWRR